MDFSGTKKQLLRPTSIMSFRSGSVSPSSTSLSSSLYNNNLSKLSDLPVHCNPQTSILNASLLLKEKRTHCLLIIDESSGKLVGLITSKDLAFKAVSKNLDSNTSISSIMTKNPYFVSFKTSPNKALKLMVDKKIRHLPIVNENELVIGILNITTCFYNVMIRLERLSETSKELQSTFNELNNTSIIQRMESSNESSMVNISNNFIIPSIKIKDNSNNLMDPNNLDLLALNEGLMDLNISRRKKKIANELKSLISIMKQPDLKSLLLDNELNAKNPFYIDAKTSIFNASQLLLKNNITAALIIQNKADEKKPMLVEDIIGILTTKDLVYRVLACEINPKNSTVARVMTSKPEFANDSMAIHNVLRLMYEGKYLNLPIKNDQDHVIGLVNVLNLTYSLLNTLNNSSLNDTQQFESNESNSSNVPAWNKFWDSLDKPLNQISNSSLSAVRRSYPSIERSTTTKRSSSFANISYDSQQQALPLATQLQPQPQLLQRHLSNLYPQPHLTNEKGSPTFSYVDLKSDNTLEDCPLSKTTISKSLLVKIKIIENLNLQMNNNVYKFNLKYDVVTADYTTTLDSIISKVKNKTNINVENLLFHIGYLDSDNDFITIDSSDDLDCAFMENKNANGNGEHQLNLIVKVLKRNNEKETKPIWNWNFFISNFKKSSEDKKTYLLFGGLGVMFIMITKFLLLSKNRIK